MIIYKIQIHIKNFKLISNKNKINKHRQNMKKIIKHRPNMNKIIWKINIVRKKFNQKSFIKKTMIMLRSNFLIIQCRNSLKIMTYLRNNLSQKWILFRTNSYKVNCIMMNKTLIKEPRKMVLMQIIIIQIASTIIKKLY